MGEIITEALQIYHLPLTILLGFLGLYWLLVLIGLTDTESFDVELHGDADLGIDAGADADAELDHHPHGGGGILAVSLRYVNVDEVPLMIVVTCLSVITWGFSLLFNDRLNESHSMLVAVPLILLSFVLSVFATKVVTAPLRPFVRALKKGAKSRPVIGRTGIVKTGDVTEEQGQVEVEGDGSPLLLNARVAPGRPPLQRGDSILVIDHDADSETYLVQALEEQLPKL